jgi:predicted deacylase
MEGSSSTNSILSAITVVPCVDIRVLRPWAEYFCSQQQEHFLPSRGTGLAGDFPELRGCEPVQKAKSQLFHRHKNPIKERILNLLAKRLAGRADRLSISHAD